MKIILSATGRDVESNINTKFGRSPFFLIVDTNTNENKSIVNETRDRPDGVGITIANIVAKEDIDVVITTDIGPLAFDIFEQCGIKIYQATGKIDDAIQQFMDGKLSEITKTTVPKYFGRSDK